MRWFKHMSGSLNDSLIYEAIEKFGPAGYLVFFGTLEMLADDFDPSSPGVARISIKKMTKNFQLSRQKTVKILRFFDQKANEKQTKNVSFFAEVEGDHVLVTCKKFAKLCDEHTRKLLSQTPELVRSESGETPAQEVRSKKKDFKPPCSPPVTNNPKPDPSQASDIPPGLAHEIVAVYHEILPELRPFVQWTSARMYDLRECICGHPTLCTPAVAQANIGWWRETFETVRRCPHLMGETGDWSADLAWLIKAEHLTAVIEGRYRVGEAEQVQSARDMTVEEILAGFEETPA